MVRKENPDLTWTTINIMKKTRDRLVALKEPRDTYEHVVKRLLDLAENAKAEKGK